MFKSYSTVECSYGYEDPLQTKYWYQIENDLISYDEIILEASKQLLQSKFLQSCELLIPEKCILGLARILTLTLHKHIVVCI